MRAIVVGAGTMGRGIAQLLALHGHDVQLADADDALTELAIASAAESLGRAAARGRISAEEASAAHARLSPDDGSAADVAIEAVPERLELKQAIIAALDERLPRGSIVATNTSSLSISAIAGDLPGRGRIVGMHFFNPPLAMPLIEIVRGGATDPGVVERARELAVSLGKEPIVVQDVPGFATSRLGILLGLEAARMLEEGVASATDIRWGRCVSATSSASTCASRSPSTWSRSSARASLLPRSCATSSRPVISGRRPVEGSTTTRTAHALRSPHDRGVRMSVARVVARSLVAGGVDAVFGVIGSGNFLLANELRDAGAPFHAARHECGAMMMADGYGRVSDRIAVCTTHQGPGFTNALTGLVEAAKARTPAVLLTADTPSAVQWSNFKIDQAAIARECGAIAERVHAPQTASADAARALHRARTERLPVVLN